MVDEVLAHVLTLRTSILSGMAKFFIALASIR
jgi:hypothetical protein